MSKPTIYTIGHSTRTIAQFVDLLRAHGVKKVVDVRTIPRSRHNPQFEEENLKRSLKAARIGYEHMAALGGLRHAAKDSPNTGWRNKSFRGFADYMGTLEFAEGLSQLEKIARQKPVAIMCAEAVPWRCHRSLIADALTKKKWTVRDITGKGKAHVHKLTPFLRMRQGRIVYP